MGQGQRRAVGKGGRAGHRGSRGEEVGAGVGAVEGR